MIIATSCKTNFLSHNSEQYFEVPECGVVSDDWVHDNSDFIHGLLTGNGTSGAIVLGRPYDENIYISHASLYLPNPISEENFSMHYVMDDVKEMCLKGEYKEASLIIQKEREKQNYLDDRDPYIGAFYVNVKQPSEDVLNYQRVVDYMTAEAIVDVTNSKGTFRRSTFASRQDTVIVMRLSGTSKQSAEFSFKALETRNDNEKMVKEEGVKVSEQGVKDGYLYFKTLFANENKFNPNIGFEGIGKVISKGGERVDSDSSIVVKDANEILLIVKVEPILKSLAKESITSDLTAKINSLNPDYDKLLKPHAKMHGEIMGRVEFSLDASDHERSMSNEKLIENSKPLDAPLALSERAFRAGRYNILCCSGFNPPNLLGLWSASWLADWSGSFTTDGNLPCAVSNNLMGNMNELMEPYFRFYDERWDIFRENTKLLYNMRGFHVPAQITTSARHTDFSTHFPLVYWHSGAAWACQYYYDYYQYTGDDDFLKDRAYPIMKEACEFYEDFLKERDENGKLIFVPSYSPENYPSGGPQTSINATMDIAGAKQLLRNTIKASEILGVDEDMRGLWGGIIQQLPSYEVDEDGYFREWLWPGLNNNNKHRHASHLYPLYDEMPPEIVDDAELVKGIENYLDYHLQYKDKAGDMAFGIVQDGLAAVHIGNSKYTQKAIKMLLTGFWTNGMASLHDRGSILNMDISGGFPYLCSSALVYADPGYIRFFPALPEGWKTGSIKGIRIRGGILIKELTWSETTASVILVSDKTQTVEIEVNDKKLTKDLKAGVAMELAL